MSDKKLEEQLRYVINCHSAENSSNTPDFILAKYLIACLDAFNEASRAREGWYGRRDVPGINAAPPPSGPSTIGQKIRNFFFESEPKPWDGTGAPDDL